MSENAKVKCLFERVFVETPVDTDGDGKYDLIAVYIKRPVDTLTGKKVPAIYVANPYMLFCNEDWYVPHDVDREVQAYPTQNIREEDIRYDFSQEPHYEVREHRETRGYAATAEIEENIPFECISNLYDHFYDRGYASVFCGGLGTRGSEGLTLTGSREEILAFKSVIDWLNGRCRAFTNKTDNIEVKADWCTGNVAMSAKSYLGTMCIGVAATGVEGLKTIIPEAAISNWYAYYRYNGLTLPGLGWQGDDLDLLAKYCCSRAKDPEDYAQVKERYEQLLRELEEGQDRASANYSRFWDERNYLNLVDRIRASVLIIHGLNDWNVKTNQCIPFFKALEERGIERKMVLHQGEHIYVYHLQDAPVLEIIERWLDHYLYGVDNGIEKESAVLVESNTDQSVWQTSETWPPRGMQEELFPIEGSGEKTWTDSLASTVFDAKQDNLAQWRDELVLSSDENYTNRLKYVWDPFHGEQSLRFAGTCQVSFEAAIDQPTAILSAMLVDLGEDTRLTNEEVPTADGQFAFGVEKEPSAYRVISRGWLNAQNRSCLWSKEEIRPGQFYSYAFDMVPTDYTIRQGHKLALIVYGIDAEATQRPATVTKITLKEDTLRVSVPLVR